MDEKNLPRFGATMERGVLLAETADGWTVESRDRPGLISPPLLPLLTNGTYGAGDRVFFFLFEDGTGRILGHMDA